MNFVRSNGGVRPGCRLGPRETFNRITSVLDGNVVYSNVPETLEELRSFEGGLMKTLPIFREQGLLVRHSAKILFLKKSLGPSAAFTRGP